MRVLTASLTILILHAFSVFPQLQFVAASGASQHSEARAQVGQYSLSLYGFASPNASINIKSDNVLLTSGAADGNGNFAFTDLPITEGFSSFCFETTDVRRLGSSEGCMVIEPAEDDVVLRDIYLPPTIGLENSTITEGSSGLTYGYSMPDASVSIQLDDGVVFQAQSDSEGRYSYTVGNLAVGKYELSSRGEYIGIQSLNPRSGAVLTVLTSSTSFINEAAELRRNLMLWGAIAALILIPSLFYLIKRYRPDWLRAIANSKLFAALPKRKGRELHHAWFVGY